VSFGSRIRPDGLFAKSRYRCVPPSGVAAAHVFTLPKRAPWHLNPDGTMCANCSHEPGRTDGAPTALRSLYSVPEVARLLVETGTGTSLRLASRNLRIENNRLSHDDAGRPYHSRQNALAADYVDRYGPTIVSATRPSRWPRFLILDSVPLNMRMRDAEAVGLPFDTEGGAVLAAAGTDDPQRPAKAWHACLAGNETGESWFDLLDSIPPDTAPEWVVADDATAIRNAVMEKWPDAVFYPCIYHLRERGKLAATADGLNYDRAVGPALETCLRSTDDWDRLRTLAQPHGGGSLWAWIEATEPTARTLEGLRRRFPPGVPESNGAAEYVVAAIRDRNGARKRNFQNARRLSILVELMRADVAGAASVRAYIRVLRAAQQKADWSLGSADDREWRAYQDPLDQVSSMTQLMLDARERAKRETTASATESQARGIARKLVEANAERVLLGVEPWELTSGMAVPTAKIPKGTKLSAFPELLRDWDPSNEYDPTQLTYGMDVAIKWICAVCGHRWTTPLNQRTLRRSRCTVCHRSWATPTTSLAALHPALIAVEWAREENLPQTPERLTERSPSTVLWSCRESPELHPLFRMSPVTRVKYDKEGRTACPDCRRQAAAKKRARTRHDAMVRAAPPPAIIGFDPDEDLPF
jgi:hypothetical protein